jgi:hypothetical protein
VDFAEVEKTILAAYRRFNFSLTFDSWQGLDFA